MTTENKNKKLVFCISETGGQGKSYIASGIADELRNRHNKTCAVYLLDNMDGSRQTFERLCKRTNGKADRDQDPINGVEIIDVLNQQKSTTGIEDNKDAIMYFRSTLMTDADFTVYDFPGQSYSWLNSLFKAELDINGIVMAGELGEVLKQTGKEIIVVVPIVEKKSLSSLQKLLETFNFKRDSYGNLVESVKILAIYNDILKNSDLSYADFEKSEEVKNCKEAFGANFFTRRLLHLENSNFLDKICKNPYSYYYDEKTNNPINLPEHVDPINFGLFIRSVVRAGFMPIVKDVFINGGKKDEDKKA